MAEYKINKTGAQIEASLTKADTAVQPADITNKENISNKVTSINSSSTDAQYTSAKCVWDNLQNVREVAEGKCKTIVIDDTLTIETIRSNANEAYLMNRDGTKTNILSQISHSYSKVVNTSFNSNDASLSFAGDGPGSGETQYIVESYKYGSFGNQNGYNFYAIGDANDTPSSRKTYFEKGDVILVIQTDVPDRWLNPDLKIGFMTRSIMSAYKLETSKVDLTNYYTKTEADALLGGKQETISDLATIRSGAALGATAVQPEAGKGLFSGNYNDLDEIPPSFTPSAHTHANATTSAAGFMSASDKTKLNSLPILYLHTVKMHDSDETLLIVSKTSTVYNYLMEIDDDITNIIDIKYTSATVGLQSYSTAVYDGHTQGICYFDGSGFTSMSGGQIEEDSVTYF